MSDIVEHIIGDLRPAELTHEEARELTTFIWERARGIGRGTLLRELAELHEDRFTDYEIAHLKADRLLLDYINDAEIRAAFEAVGRWYS